MTRPPIHDLFFGLAVFFLIGIFFSSIISGVGAFLSCVLLVTVFLFFDKKFLAIICLVAILGAAYYSIFDYLNKNSAVIFDKKIEFESVVHQAKQRFSNQELILDNNIKIITMRYPEFHYGDQLLIEGVIKRSRYALISGLISYPKIELVATERGNLLKTVLIKARLAFENNLKRILPHDKAVFLSGLTMGDIGEISPPFYAAMKASGTTHLVALSGQNISIVIFLIFGILGFFLPKRLVFIPTIVLMSLFVVMTGAEASLVRAAIMGFIILLAEKSQRLFSLRNALTAAALIMVLYNPKVLVFDLGFQLSFVAMLGIGYLQPFLEKITGWQHNIMKKLVWPSISAQAAVLPLLLLKFGYFNPLSIIANILIAPIVPYTMILGFIVGTVSFFSYWLAFLMTFPVNILLTYAVLVINIFASSW